MENAIRKTIAAILGITLAVSIMASFMPYSVSAATKKTVKPARPKITNVTYRDEKFWSSRTIKFKWKKAKHAKKYEAYRKIGSGKYKKIKTTTGTSASFETKNMRAIKVYVKVRSVNGKKKSSFSTKTLSIPRAEHVIGDIETFTLGPLSEEVKLGSDISPEYLEGTTPDGLMFGYYKGSKWTVMAAGKGYIDWDYSENPYPPARLYFDVDVFKAENEDFDLYIRREGVGYFVFKPKKAGVTLSLTLDGTKPEYNQAFTTGKLKLFGDETIVTRQSFSEEISYEYGLIYMDPAVWGDESGIWASIYQPYSDENQNGYDFKDEDGKVYKHFWDANAVLHGEDINPVIIIYKDETPIGRYVMKYKTFQ